MKLEYRKIKDINLLIDGVIFQIQKGEPKGISKVWSYILKGIDHNNLFGKVAILDRGHCPEFKSIKNISWHSFSNDNGEERQEIASLMDREDFNVFISSYYTGASNHFNIALVHDFIPEVLGLNLNSKEWINKEIFLNSANAYFCISESTLKDLNNLYPERIWPNKSIVYNHASPLFRPISEGEVSSFLKKEGISAPYFVTIGNRMGYKNLFPFFKALGQISTKKKVSVVCVGGHQDLEYIFAKQIQNKGIKVFNKFYDDNELAILLNGATCLIYPSLYEGFGLPILEAFACRCPILLSNTASSCIEIAKDGGIYVEPRNISQISIKLSELIKNKQDEQILKKNQDRAKEFTLKLSMDQFYQGIKDNLNKISKYYQQRRLDNLNKKDK